MKTNWSSSWYPAPAALEGFLAGIWSVRAADQTDLAARVLPDGSTSLVFRRDGTLLRTGDGGGTPWAEASVSGPRTGPFDFNLGAAGQIFIVQLHPAGAMNVLGVPMSSLANRFENLAAVVGPISPQFSDLVLADTADTSCVRAIEQWLLERVRAQLINCARTNAAVQEVTRRGGSIRIEDLAEHVNLSRRHLVRIMTEHIGASPKLFARITRFHKAVQLGRFRPRVPWVQIALDSGYADQAHMSREFSEFGGIRPSDLRGAQSATIW